MEMNLENLHKKRQDLEAEIDKLQSLLKRSEEVREMWLELLEHSQIKLKRVQEELKICKKQ